MATHPGSAGAPRHIRMSASQVGERLHALSSPCALCERRCGVHRADGERGLCGLSDEVAVYNRLIHVGEEDPLVPSYAIFLSGCSLSCSFCSEWQHLKPPFKAPSISPLALARAVTVDLERAPEGARPTNINFVGGEPTVALPFIADFVVAAEGLGTQLPPVLLNTNGFVTPEALALATHLAELFVVDFKYGNDRCASEVAGIEGYWETLTRNLRALGGGPLDPGPADGVPLMPVTLWVRHLLMPGHLECCTRPVLAWLSEHLPEAHVNVMPAFVPTFGAPGNRWPWLKAEEREEAIDLLRSSDLTHRFFDGRRVRS